MSEHSSAPTPSFRGRGRGRGRSQAVRAHVARLAQARKAANGRRGRQKLYDHPKPQAASERLKELKAAYSAVANAIRPALEDLADRNIERLKSRLNAHRELQEYQDIKSFLESRLRQAQAINSNQLVLDTRLKDYIYEKSRAITETSFVRDCDDATDRFLDAQLMRLDRLEMLHDNELPIDIIDDTWNFHEISDERFRDVKAHVEYRTDRYGNKIEVPCAKTLTGRRLGLDVADVADDNALKPSPKRKADDEADLPPPRKRLLGASDEPAPSSAPRHIGGLLSAVVAPTDEEDDEEAEAVGSPGVDSKVPSPSPALAEEEEELLEEDDTGTPVGEEDDAAATYRPSEKLPPLPNGASEPDAFGVRLVNKRRTANFDVYNRILVPALFDFEPHEIGFRDSTNDKSRGATKAKRGKFIGTPNSNTMHFDRSLWQYDATTYEDGEIDDELVKKHQLHPKYGIFLRTSVNEEEAPKKRVSGMNPVVFYTPHGRTFNSSRSVKAARLEDGAEAASSLPELSAAFSEFVELEGVAPQDIQPEEELVEGFREKKMKLWLGPRRVIRDETEEQEDKLVEAEMEDVEEAEDEVLAKDRKVAILQRQDEEEEDAYAAAMQADEAVGMLLEAAATADAEMDEPSYIQTNPYGDEMAYAAPMAAPASSTTPPPPRRAASRPFDPVRDVFTDSAPADNDGYVDRRRSSTDYYPSSSNMPREQPPPYADASNLLYIASLASDQEYIPTTYHQPTYQQPQPPSYHQQQPQPPLHHLPRAPPLMQQQQQQPYPPTEPLPADYPPPPPSRRMSMDPPEPYPPPQAQHPPPPQLLDPRLFGESAPPPPHQQLPPPDVAGGSGSNGYGHGGYYQQQQQHQPTYLHNNYHQGGARLPSPHAGPPPPADYYSQPPPPPSSAYGQRPQSAHAHPTLPPPQQQHGMAPLPLDASPSRRSSQYYMSPPPPPPPQPLAQQMRPTYQNSYGPPQGEPESMLPPPSSSIMTQQQGLPPPPHLRGAPPPYHTGPPPLQSSSQPPGVAASPGPLPPPALHQQSAMAHQSSLSPQVYPAQPSMHDPPHQHHYPYSSNDYQRHHSGSSPPPPPPPAEIAFVSGDPQQQQLSSSNGSNMNGTGNGNSNKYRKLEPAPMMAVGASSQSRWSRSSNSPSGNLADPANPASVNAAVAPGLPPLGPSGSVPPSSSTTGGPTSSSAPSAKELRTVPYDYEKIKDYAAVEPPPSHGPKAIRGWAHNNVKRGSRGSGGGSIGAGAGAGTGTGAGTPGAEAGGGAPVNVKAEPPDWDKEEKQQQ